MNAERRQDRDEGFSLVEVIVASAIFLAMGAAVAASLVVAVRASMANEGKVQAASLAARQIDLARSADVSDLGDTSYDVTRSSLAYHVTQTVDSQTIDTGGSACDGASGAEAIKRISVVVTWDGMGNTAPVRSDTYRNLPITGSDANKGTLTFKVIDRNGNPKSGAPIALRKSGTLVKTSTTGIDGCVVFSSLTPGTDYTGTLTQAGYLSDTQETTMSRANVVVAKKVTKDPGFVWDAAANVTVTAEAPSGYPIPTSVPLTLFRSSFTGGAKILPTSCSTTPCAPVSVSGTRATWTVTSVFPFSSGYPAASGNCGTACVRNQTTLTTTPGQTTTGTVANFGGVDARAGSLLSGVVTNYAVRQMKATNADNSSESYTFPTSTGSDGTPARIALPPGQWYIDQANATNNTYRVLVTVQPGLISTAGVQSR